MYISREKGYHYYIQTRHKDRFSRNPFLGKLKGKLARKAPVNTVASISDRAHVPGHPIILLKSNYFNMAAALEKRSINYCSAGDRASYIAMWSSVGVIQMGVNNLPSITLRL